VPKSIVLITVDCLRADHVAFGGYGRPTTPFLDSLARDSFVFSSAIVAGTPTYYSFPAIFAARAPLALGRDVLGLARDEPTLASVLKENGYATAAFSGANPYISPRFGYDQGFDVFRDFLDAESGDDSSRAEAGGNGHVSANGRLRPINQKLQQLSRTLPPLALLYEEAYFQYCQRWAAPPARSLDALRRFPSADRIVSAASSWLTTVGRRPFFLWLHLMDPHAPYYPTQNGLELMGRRKISAQRARYLNAFWQRSDLSADGLERHRDEVIALYDAGIRWVDAQVEILVHKMRDRGLWEDCILALTADHGEEFLDHGGRYHPPAGLMEELIRVPLVLRGPGAGPKKMVTSPFSLANLAPTLIDVAEATRVTAFENESRWKQIRTGSSWDEAAIVECVAGCTNPFHRDSGNRLRSRVIAVREARYKMIFDFGNSQERLYDLQADPGEQRPLAGGTATTVRRRLLECGRRHIERSRSERNAEQSLRARLSEIRLEWSAPAHKSATASF
jgi:arylsulfatase A-like enzyme